MWIVWTLVAFAVLAYLGYAWVVSLVTKYSHTLESIAVLAVLAALSAGVGIKVANQVIPGWSLGPTAALVAGVGFTAFTLFSFLVVNLWCSFLTRKFDEKIASLEEEEDAILRRLDSMRWDAIRRAEFSQKPEQNFPKSTPEDERSVLRKTVETWEQGGGAARIRSIKVLEWREDIKGKAKDSLAEELREAEIEARSDPDESRREQARVRAALLTLEIMKREGRVEPKVSPVETTPKLPEAEIPSRERLQTILGEIDRERKAKAEFMRQRIRLTWRTTK